MKASPQLILIAALVALACGSAAGIIVIRVLHSVLG